MTVHSTLPRIGLARPVRSQAAFLQRLAAFITEQHLPEGDLVLFRNGNVIVDLTDRAHSSGEVQRWAHALDTIREQEYEVVDSRLHVLHTARGLLPDGTFVKVVAREVVTEAVR